MNNNQQFYGQYNGQPMQPKKDKSGKYFGFGLFAGIVLTTLVVFGLVLTGRLANLLMDDTAGLGKDVSSEETAITIEMVQKLELIEDIIDKYFYKENIDREVLAEGAFRGMVDALGDPYSTYYSYEELLELYSDSAGVYYGIGAYVSIDEATSYPMISGVISGAPAEEADLRANDIVYKVNGKDVYGMTLEEVVSLIKGEEGTKVNLTLVRDGVEIEKEVVRRKVEKDTVTHEIYDNGIAYIQITEFDTVTESEFKEAMTDAKAADAKGIIIDLRSNPGGNLSTVNNIARQLLPKGLITYTVDRDGKRQEYTCDGRNEIQIPLVVLIDGNSASASEILAGAIKDYGIGTLVGTTTYGKGIVQRPIEMTDGSAVKLTISTYYTPNGNNVHGEGITPDIEVKFDSERYYSDEKYDNQKEEAIKILLDMIEE